MPPSYVYDYDAMMPTLTAAMPRVTLIHAPMLRYDNAIYTPRCVRVVRYHDIA